MHTTTGLVERHIDLVKMSMLKIQAESGRYGIELEMEELAAEAAMSQNLNLMQNNHLETSLQKAALNDHYD